MSAVDPTANPSISPGSVRSDWDDLTPNQIAARNQNEAQRATRFQPGNNANPTGRNQHSRPQALGLFDYFSEYMVDEEDTRLKAAALAWADAVADLHPVWFAKFLDREWPTVNKLQAEVLTAEVRIAPELPDTDEVRQAVAEALDADYEVIEGGDE